MSVVDRARELRKVIESMSTQLSDEEALTVRELFPIWESEKNYSVGDRIRYNDTLYKCVQAHTSQSGWTPDITPALWVVVSLDEYPEWVQPIGVQDAYNKGDKVSHNDKHWISTIDVNVWEPGVYGWDEEQG